MVRVPVLKRLYNLSDELMEYQLLDHMSYQRFCLLQDSMNVPERKTIWRLSERIGAVGPKASQQGVDEHLHRHDYIAQDAQAIDATLVAAPHQNISKDDRQKIDEGQSDWSGAKRCQRTSTRPSRRSTASATLATS